MAVGLMLGALAQRAEAGPAGDPAAQWPAVAAAQLDAMRGGFVSPGGLELSLGIDRIVMFNGTVLAHNSLHIADVARIGREQLASEQALQSDPLLAGLDAHPGGAVNLAAPAWAVPTPGALLVQNSLNGQRIDSRTVINASVNTGAVLSSLNFQRSLGDALIRSAGAH
ncbi:MAG: hypothetical protein ACLGI6_19200 [Gammaproteobacteria bacterium]